MYDATEAKAQVLPGSTGAPAGELPQPVAGKLALDGYFVATTAKGTGGVVLASLSPIYMTMARAARECDALQEEFPRCAVLVVHLFFDPDDAGQMAELLDYLRQHEQELAGAQ
jgi:hypothetical protein